MRKKQFKTRLTNISLIRDWIYVTPGEEEYVREEIAAINRANASAGHAPFESQAITPRIKDPRIILNNIVYAINEDEKNKDDLSPELGAEIKNLAKDILSSAESSEMDHVIYDMFELGWLSALYSERDLALEGISQIKRVDKMQSNRPKTSKFWNFVCEVFDECKAIDPSMTKAEIANEIFRKQQESDLKGKKVTREHILKSYLHGFEHPRENPKFAKN